MTHTPVSEERDAGKSFRPGARTDTQATRDTIGPTPERLAPRPGPGRSRFS
jgi:hypothetical protein